MPIFEYQCQRCGKEFEELIRVSKQVVCPHCGSENVKKLISRFGFKVTPKDKGEWLGGPKK